MIGRRLPRIAAAAALCLAAGVAQAQTLPLPQGLVDLRSQQGRQLLLGSEAFEAYVPLSVHFVTQRNQAFCGVASIVMVLNALGIPGPDTPEYRPHRIFSQENLLDERTEAVLPRATLARQGMTLDEVGRLLALHPVAVEVRHAGDSDLDEFRALAVRHLSEPDHFVVVNYLRRAIGQERGGHISPLAAYDADTDRFLVLDVSRYKYPPVWVAAPELFAAMDTADADNQGRTRGFVLVRKAGAAAAARAD